MRFEVELEKLPGGIAAHSIDAGKTGQIIQRDFATDANGQQFYNYLELLSPFLTPFIKAGHRESRIDNCLVIIDKTKRATVYVDEPMILQPIPKKTVKAGDNIYKEDIAGIISLSLRNTSIPPDSGILFFSLKDGNVVSSLT